MAQAHFVAVRMCPHRRLRVQYRGHRVPGCCRAAATSSRETVKRELTQLVVSPKPQDSEYRARVEELQVDLESFGGDIDYEVLQGLWKLEYTTAPDVVPLFLAGNLPILPGNLPLPRVSAIYQRFTSREEGVVQNIIQAGDGFVLERDSGATFIVNARFQPSGPRTIELIFESAQVAAVNITDGVEALLAPAVLPRSTLQQRLLLGLKQFSFKLPLPTPSSLGSTANKKAATGKYRLTYMDDDLLIGRAQAGAGVFIFSRSSALPGED